MARILIVAGHGTASDHLDYAYFRMLEEGFDVTIAAPEKGGIKTAVHMGLPGAYGYATERAGYVLPAHASFDEVDPTRYDGLLLPGGRAPEYMRNMPRCVDLVRHFVGADKPIGAICHGPMLLIAAGVKGRQLSCTNDLELEIIQGGNTYVPTRGFLGDGEPDHVVDGNIVTTFRRPFHHVWIREFLALLEARGISRPNKLDLPGKKILLIAGDYTSGGQLSYAADRMREAHCEVTVAAPDKSRRLDTVIDMREEGWDMRDFSGKYDFENIGFWIQPHATFDEIDTAKFHGLMLPGWRATEYLRNLPACLKPIREFVASDKPIGAICQGTQLLLAVGVKGRRLTGLSMMKCEIARDNTYVDARADAITDGNIVTVSGRPYYHVWTRSFLSQLARQPT